ncbi:MAG: hypothetical protein Q8S73_12190 [Deltaproteobacteria bacterium]|nr:hypothetical protein [Myxococcales bacterium]MDP3214858.1 hypothetical protein [Deltaproteobacteria bacterium]
MPTARARPAPTAPLVTPDGRYLVVRGRLWRRANPALADDVRAGLVGELMDARRAVSRALRASDDGALRAARARVHAAKVALGERGPVWWTDGSPDLNRRLAKNTLYAPWYAAHGPG